MPRLSRAAAAAVLAAGPILLSVPAFAQWSAPASTPERKAKVAACEAQADAYALRGKIRKEFRDKCVNG